MQEQDSQEITTADSNPEALTGEPATALPDSPAPSVIVVHDRPHRWSLGIIGPILVLLAACAVLSMRIHAPDWLGLSPRHATASPAASTDRPLPPSPTPEQSDDRNSTLPPGVLATGSPPVAVDIEAVPEAPASEHLAPPPIKPPVVQIVPADRGIEVAALPDLDNRAMPPLTPEPAQPAAAALPHPEAEEVWADIKRDAEKQQAGRAELQRIKDNVLEDEVIKETKEELQARSAFLTELAKIIKQPGPRAVDQIRDLVATAPQGRYLPGDVDQLARFLSTSREKRLAWAFQQRAQGIGESQILDVLERAQTHNHNARNGPSNADEALLRAAQEVLSLPLVAFRPKPPVPDAPTPLDAAPTPNPGRRREGKSSLPPSVRRTGR